MTSETSPLFEDDFFKLLEAEAAKHIAADKLKKDRDAAKKRANTMTLPTATRARASEEYREISKMLEAAEWEAIATIALFTEQSCDGCGSVHYTFLQYMEHQRLVRKHSTARYVRVSRPAPETVLPRETLLQPMTTHMCGACCEDHGFALLTANRLTQRSDVITASPTYHQEDINAEAA